MSDEAMYSAALLRQFEAKQSSDDLKSDLELTCVACREVICDIEADDVIDVLASLMADHACKARWWVIEGDDHEQRIVEADSEDTALILVAADFAEQYDADYNVPLAVLGIFDTEEDAQDEFPEAQ